MKIKKSSEQKYICCQLKWHSKGVYQVIKNGVVLRHFTFDKIIPGELYQNSNVMFRVQ